jgi:hypothetical protein
MEEGMLTDEELKLMEPAPDASMTALVGEVLALRLMVAYWWRVILLAYGDGFLNETINDVWQSVGRLALPNMSDEERSAVRESARKVVIATLLPAEETVRKAQRASRPARARAKRRRGSAPRNAL